MIYGLVILFLVGIFLLTFMFLEAKENKISYHSFEFDDFPESFGLLRIFFISDIHRRKINPSIISEAMGKVDYVIIGGDLTEKGVPFSRIDENIRQLTKLGRTFFIWGNNDYEINRDQLISLFKKHDVQMLNNDTVMLQAATGQEIALIGIEDIGQEQDDLGKAMETINRPCFQILLSHNPSVIKKIKNIDSISLILSGHTHGGQIRIFGYGPYKKGGVYTYDHVIQFISNGYGTSLVPLRLGAKPETHIITLKKACSKGE